ncbi:MAG: hypothetical protein ACC641_04195 [Acidiferrobacterales bacterium]
MAQFRACVLILGLVFLVSCSGDQEPEEGQRASGDYVWKPQVESMKIAREIEAVLKKETEKYKDDIEQQSQ